MRHFEMRITVEGFDENKLPAIEHAVEREWNIEGNYGKDNGCRVFFGESDLAGGETEQEFTERVGHAIWEANEAFCEVGVDAVYLDDLPTEFFCLDEDDYSKWRKGAA